MIDKSKYFKKIKKGGEYWDVLDFAKIRELPYHRFLLITERGLTGKTYGGIENILERWKEKGEKAVWIYNTMAQWYTTYNRFITNNKTDNPQKWKDITCTIKGLFDKKEQFCYFVSISGSTKEKGARNYKIKTIWYDEINENIQLLGKGKQTALFKSLIHSFSDPFKKGKDLKVFMFCNMKTLANQFLNDLGITRINQEIEIIDGKLWFYSSMPTKAELERIGKDNWIYDYDKDSFSNENMRDNISGIFEDDELNGFMRKATKGGYLYTQGRYFSTYYNVENLYFSPLKVKPLDDEIFCAKYGDLDDGIIFNIDLIGRWRNFACQKKLKFKDYNTKITILSLLGAY